jgi:fructose-1,6-bisphosphatase/sedoheptulose 1,7-bisphosphatase-like protein
MQFLQNRLYFITSGELLEEVTFLGGDFVETNLVVIRSKNKNCVTD